MSCVMKPFVAVQASKTKRFPDKKNSDVTWGFEMTFHDVMYRICVNNLLCWSFYRMLLGMSTNYSIIEYVSKDHFIDCVNTRVCHVIYLSDDRDLKMTRKRR